MEEKLSESAGLGLERWPALLRQCLNPRFFEVLNYDFGGGLICDNGRAGGAFHTNDVVESKMAREMLCFTIETAVVGGEGRICEKEKVRHAVQRKRCGSLRRSFSYWEAAPSLRPPLPTLGKRLLEPRRPLVGAFRRSSGVCPSPAGFSFFREKTLQKWSGCLAGHWGERFQAKFWD